jgi:hypothetical protein
MTLMDTDAVGLWDVSSAFGLGVSLYEPIKTPDMRGSKVFGFTLFEDDECRSVSSVVILNMK